VLPNDRSKDGDATEGADPSLFRAAFDALSEGLFIADGEGRIVAVNGAFTAITGFTEDEARGRDSWDLRSLRVDAACQRDIAASLCGTGRWRGELWGRRKAGSVYREALSLIRVPGGDPDRPRHVGAFRDITEIRETVDRLWRESNYDWLTELPNRGLFLDRLLQALVAAGTAGRRVALLFAGIDGFKVINDTFGHTIGDKVLYETARRFAAALGHGDTLARFGGDEFTIALTGIASVDDVEARIRGLLASLQTPFVIEGHHILLSCSIGACLWPGDGDDVETLMRNATSAMQEAKSAGRNTFRFFTVSMDARARARGRLAGELSGALENGEFTLAYQPLVEAASGRIIGAEALLRWNSRYLGAVSPVQFIPLAEEMGLIMPIGNWLFGAVCAEAAAWQSLGAGPIQVAVNVSPRQMHHGDVPAALGTALAESGLDPRLLCVEITEGVLLASSEEILADLGRLKALGCRLAVDDFGTGFASLSYLKQFPIDILKIDRSFVCGALDRAEDARLIEGIVALGHSMDMIVLGEGVENAAQLEFLRAKACDHIQGYLVSPPLSAAAFRQFLVERV
jgi:diguanylate cyclase (GGDEF)-like protein/PAS domain S-box-containing protein